MVTCESDPDRSYWQTVSMNTSNKHIEKLDYSAKAGPLKWSTDRQKTLQVDVNKIYGLTNARENVAVVASIEFGLHAASRKALPNQVPLLLHQDSTGQWLPQTTHYTQ